MDHFFSRASTNLSRLSQSPYPGDGIVVGLSGDGVLVLAYWVMQQREQERNQMLVSDGKRVFIETVHPTAQTFHPHDVMHQSFDGAYTVHIAGNGPQTDLVKMGYAVDQADLYKTMGGFSYKLDEHHTSRITAVAYWNVDETVAEMSMIRKSEWNKKNDKVLHHFGSLGIGFGHCITTYGFSAPVHDFRGEPYLLLVGDTINEVADTYWNALNEENRVSLVVKFIPRNGTPEFRIINKYGKAA